MVKVNERFREDYQSFREEMGCMLDDISYRIKVVNNTLKVTHLENVNIESVAWTAYLAGVRRANALEGQVKGLRALCEQNRIEIPEEHHLIQLGRKRL